MLLKLRLERVPVTREVHCSERELYYPQFNAQRLCLQRSKMLVYNVVEVVDEHEFELLKQQKEELIFYLVSLGEEGRHERRWEVGPINTRREEQW